MRIALVLAIAACGGSSANTNPGGADGGGGKLADGSTTGSDGGALPVGNPLYVGLYSWNEIVTYETGITNMGETIHRLAGTIDDDTWAATLRVGSKVMYTANGTDVPTTLANIDTTLMRYGPAGTYWTDHPSAPNHPIEAVEILNEPNFYNIDASTYADVLVAAYPHIKASWPAVIVVGMAIGDASAAAGDWIPKVFSANPAVATSMDVFSFHPYTGAIAPDQDLTSEYFGTSIAAHIAQLHTIAEQNGLSASIPWWVTEIGYQIDQADGGTYSVSGTVTPTQQAAYNLRFDIMCVRQNIPRVYHMFTDDTDGYNGGYFTNDTQAARPVAVATKQLLALLDGYTSLDAVSEDYGGGNPFVYRFHMPTKTVIVAWAQTPQTTSITVAGNTTVTDMLGNVITTTTDATYSASLSETPIFLVSDN